MEAKKGEECQESAERKVRKMEWNTLVVDMMKETAMKLCSEQKKGTGTAFVRTKRNEITFRERKGPHYSHQQQLLTATLPINKEHLRVWLLNLWT
nr:COX assembly mitochondrial protein homolog isoform X2 [Pogona vitticeps]